MSTSLLGIVTVTMTIRRLGDGGLDDYGRSRPATPLEITVPGCLLHQQTSVTPLDADRIAVVDGDELIVPPGGPAVLTDDVLVDPAGNTYTVNGRPQKLSDPALGIDHGALITLVRESG